MTENILLVEDEEPVRGYTVHTARGGRDALAQMTEVVPDLLLLDINLPDLTGWEVLRRLSPTDRQRVPVIVLSAAPMAQARVEEFRPSGVLLKPFPIDALLRLVGEAIGRSETEDLDA
jgi:CheY-like chemotaxis protein